MRHLSFEVPYPPSVNTYWRRVGARTIISRKGRKYREAVQGLVKKMGVETTDEPVRVYLEVYPPDARRRDIDNILKALLDGLASRDKDGFKGVYEDDSQIVALVISKGEPVRPNGLVRVQIMGDGDGSEILSEGCNRCPLGPSE